MIRLRGAILRLSAAALAAAWLVGAGAAAAPDAAARGDIDL